MLVGNKKQDNFVHALACVQNIDNTGAIIYIVFHIVRMRDVLLLEIKGVANGVAVASAG